MIAERTKMINKKGRPSKNQHLSNGEYEKSKVDSKKQKRRKKKAFEEAQDEVVKQITEGSKKEFKNVDLLSSEQEELLQFVDSSFGTRVKRKCVLQNEGKSKENWWSDDADDDDDVTDEIEEEIIDDENVINEKKRQQKRLALTAKKKEVRKRRKGGGGRPSNKHRREQEEEEPVFKEQTIHCYVFSTAMANRAGHAVKQEIFKSISDYHHGQKWETPYLVPEIHCRPFCSELENLEADKSKEEKIVDIADSNTQPQKLDEVVNHEEKTSAISNDVKNENIEHNVKNENTEFVNSLKHPRMNLSKPLSLSEPSNDDVKVTANNTQDKRSSDVKQDEPTTSTPPKVIKLETEINNKAIEEKVSKDISNLSQPPPLTSVHEPIKTVSYPADISKDLFKLQPRENGNNRDEFDAIAEHRNESVTRPSVLNMAIERKSDVRSSIDVAEKMLKDSRDIRQPNVTTPHQLPPFTLKSSTGPIFPRDVHPSVFMSMHSSHLFSDHRYRPFQGHDLKPAPNDSLFAGALRHKSPFTPPPINHPQHKTSFPSGRNEIPYSMYSKRDTVDLFPRRNSGSPVSFQKPEPKYCEPYKPLSSSIKNGLLERPLLERPSSLPVPTHRIEKQPPKSFSVESLTKPTFEKHVDSVKALHNGSEKSSHVIDRSHFLAEQELLRDRSHHNGINGLKRSFDERLSNHMRERMHENSRSPFLEKYDARYLAGTERDRLESERILNEKEHFLHRTRLPYPSPPGIRRGTETTISSMTAPPLPTFLKKSSRNGVEPPPPVHTFSPYLQMGLSYVPPPFSHR